MKKLLLIVFIFIQFNQIKSQVVFCPKGAEWRYNFFFVAGGNPQFQKTYNEKIYYLKDSVVGSDTYKVLKHNWFYPYCSGEVYYTLIRQVGDTVFMSNTMTQGKWEILYNFNVQPGDSWQTKVLRGYGTPPYENFTIKVNSISTVTINSMPLKQLFVSYSTGVTPSYSATITERFGSNQFLFNYVGLDFGTCDGLLFNRFLCYTDQQFGNIQFGSTACDYGIYLGVSSLETKAYKVNVYPNPVIDKLRIKFEEDVSRNLKLSISSALGQEVLVKRIGSEYTKGLRESGLELDVRELKKGIYFLRVFDNGKLVATEKIIKE